MPLNEGAINQILPFAPDGTEAAGDLEALASYADHVLRLRGHQPGLARREIQNRVNRQTAHIASGLAQFIANRYAAGVVDDGDLDKVEEGLTTAIAALISDAVGDIPAASTTVSGIVELATTTEATTGTDTTRAVTPAGLKAAIDDIPASSVPAASTTVSGIVELATTTEATTGTDTTRAVTPAGVKAAIDASVPAASTTVSGIVELATTTEATTGTDTTRAVTPAGVKAAIGANVVAVDQGHDNIGSFAFAINNTTTEISAGATISGADLRVSHSEGDYSTVVGLGVLSGTWRCLGKGTGYEVVEGHRERSFATLWQRIS